MAKRREEIQLHVTELNFADVELERESYPQTLLVSNIGYDTVTIYQTKLLGDFVLRSLVPATILPGETVEIQLAFVPSKPGATSGSFYLDTGDAAGEEYVALRGAGIPKTDHVPGNELRAFIGEVIGDTYADEATALAGSSTNKLMNPLTVKKVVAARAGDYATATQGTKADSAVQPSSLAKVATSGKYVDLSGLPALGSAAAKDITAFATATQGGKADSAVQPAALALVATSGKYTDLSAKPTLGTAAAAASSDFAAAAAGVPSGGSTGQTLRKSANTDFALEWSNPPGGGDMQAATYDAAGKAVNVYDMANMVESTTNKIMTATERTKLSGIATGATVTNAATVGAAIAGVSQVASPADGDRFGGVLSGGSSLFWTTWGNLKALLKGYFDGFYILSNGSSWTPHANDVRDTTKYESWLSATVWVRQTFTAATQWNFLTSQAAFYFDKPMLVKGDIKAGTTFTNIVLTDAGAALKGGFTATMVDDGIKSSGTYMPSPVGGNFRKITCNGLFIFTAPTAVGSYNLEVDITNGATPGAITFSGFATGFPNGDAHATVASAKFKLHISKTDLGTTATLEALQ